MAGNIGKERRESFTNTQDLVTPTLKADHYTTGRGGTGNMAKNDPNHPEIARAAQDVEAPAPHDNDGPHHFGRGGAANIAKPNEESRLAKDNNQRSSQEQQRDKGLVDKGKEFLGKIGAKK